MSNRDYGYGPVSYDEWVGVWKMHPKDMDVTGEEFDRVYEEIDLFLNALIVKQAKGKHLKTMPFYCRGDNLVGDRTQIVDIRDQDYFNLNLVLSLQNFLKENAYSNWRIIIPYDEPMQGTVVVYEKCIRWGKEVECSLYEQAIDSIIFE